MTGRPSNSINKQHDCSAQGRASFVAVLWTFSVRFRSCFEVQMYQRHSGSNNTFNRTFSRHKMYFIFHQRNCLSNLKKKQTNEKRIKDKVIKEKKREKKERGKKNFLSFPKMAAILKLQKLLWKCSSSPVEQDKLPHLSHQHKRKTDTTFYTDCH